MFCKDNEKWAVLLCFAPTFCFYIAVRIPKFCFCPFTRPVANFLFFCVDLLTMKKKRPQKGLKSHCLFFFKERGRKRSFRPSPSL